MANPTTNYGFVLPTATDLVTDLPADFDVALQGVDTRLKALQPGTTLGDLAYSSATANTNTRLGIGSAGQVLTVASGVPSWATPAGGGKVLQVVQFTTTTGASNTTTTLADTGLAATITPSSATSKVLIMVAMDIGYVPGGAPGSAADRGVKAAFFRGATNIKDIMSQMWRNINVEDANVAMNYIDSPATTSATTYKVQWALGVTPGTTYFNANSGFGTMILMEIGA